MSHSILAENQARPDVAVSPDASARPGGRFETVLVGVDGTSTGRDAIALGDALRAPGGRLILAHVIQTHFPTSRTFHSTSLGRNAHAMLEQEREAAGVSAGLARMLAPSVRSGLDQLGDDFDADLLVIGASRGGTIRRLLGRTYTLRSPAAPPVRSPLLHSRTQSSGARSRRSAWPMTRRPNHSARSPRPDTSPIEWTRPSTR